MKRCTKCGQEKRRRTEFRAITRKGGAYYELTVCRACELAADRKRRGKAVA